jgi:hypothetical protein
MAGLNDRKTAVMWAIGWWFTRRYLRRRASRAVAGVGVRASARRGSLRSVAAALALVGALAAAFVVWRRFGGSSGPDDRGWDDPPPIEPVPSSPSPAEAVAA